MNYTIFFVVFLGIGTVVFLGIIGAAWISAAQDHDHSRPFGPLDKPTTETVPEYSTNGWSTPPPGQTETEVIQITTSEVPLDQINTTVTYLQSTTESKKEISSEEPQSSTTPASFQPQSNSDARDIFNFRDYNYSSCNFTELNSTKGEISPKYNNFDSCTEWLVLYEDGYSVDISIERLELDGASNDFLLISAGPDFNTEEGIILFTWNLKSKKQYRIPDKGMAYILFVTHKSAVGKPEGFQLKYNRAGELTTEAPSTTPSSIPKPPQDKDVTVTMTIMCGNCKTNSSGFIFMDEGSENGFKKALASQTNKYCEQDGIILLHSASETNVIIYSKWPCVQTWPEHEKCVHLKVAVAVEHSASHYELSQEHLQRLWDEWNGEELKDYNMKKFDIPHYKRYVLFWSLGFGLVIILLTVAIFYLWQLYLRCVFRKNQIEQIEEPKKSLEVPPFFNTYEEQIDDPEYLPYYSRYSVGTETSTDDVTFTYDKLPYENPYNGFSFRPQRAEPMAQVNKGFFAEEEEEEYEVMDKNKMINDLNKSTGNEEKI